MNEKDKFAFDTGRTIGKLEAEVEKLRAELGATPRWKPIADCPKDGTIFLGGAMIDGQLSAQTAYYKYTIAGYEIFICPFRECIIGPFTHFMDIPDIEE